MLAIEHEKKVVAILGAKKDGNTHNLLKFLEKQFNKDKISLKIINLNEKNIQDCRGCETCVFGDGCVIQDDMPEILDALKKSDGIIMASPVYNNNVSGKMKMFIDKTVKWSHSPVLTSKPYIGLSTTSSSGLDITLNYLNIVGINWGAHPVGVIWASKRTTNMKKNKKVLNRFISTINQDVSEHEPSLKQVIEFNKKKVLAETVFPNDYDHWRDNNWLDMNYYYECKIGLFKRAMGAFLHWMLYKILNKAMKKYKDDIGTQRYGKLVYE